jgi:alkaline phosphatase D
MKSIMLFFVISISFLNVFSQQNNLISGPWAGNVGLRTATIWAEVSSSVKNISVRFSPSSGIKKIRTILYKGEAGNDFNPVKIELNGLQLNTTYNYDLILDGKLINPGFKTQFTTQDLWQWRKPAPDFSFLAGSCNYVNEPLYDRPGKPYGGDSTIFETMGNTPAAFHIWMGDNWYTREVDFESVWGMNYRASHDRSQKVLQKFMASMPQYAIWDDHDYGPNDAGKSFIYKNESRQIFKNYMLNPSYGEDEKGIYTKISYSDVDVFLTDDRFFRSEDEMPDSVNGSASAAKHFFGPQQMEWLKNSLQFSTATFKIIVIGSQVLNPLDKYESMQRYPAEYNEMMDFIAAQKINGVVFFTGDRHHSEVIKKERAGLYPLYDVTISPYTSGVSKVSGAEINNPSRVTGTLVEKKNFGKITISGAKNNRKMNIDFIGAAGEKLALWSVDENELKHK